MVDGNTCPFRCFALCAKGAPLWLERRTWLSFQLVPGVFLERFPRHKLPMAYLRESLLVLHLQLLFQGGVEFPTGGKSGGAKGALWRR